MTTITAKVIADSISNSGDRITTLQLRYPRFIHSELLTHRQFSRNSQSNRAVAFSEVVQDILLDPVVPIYWGVEKKGMQASEEVSETYWCESDWLDSRDYAVKYATRLHDELGLHKQICNRLLEPYQHINTLVTATDFTNFFKLRLAKDAEPHIQELAKQMKLALDTSEPDKLLDYAWHLPYITLEEYQDDFLHEIDLLKMSVARCARISYNNQGKQYPIEKELEFTNKLYHNGHMSPFEHVARSCREYPKVDNFTGWASFRNILKHDKYIKI